MATITPVSVNTAGATVTYAAASGGGDTIVPAGARPVNLRVKNASGGSINVTFTGVVHCSRGFLHDTVIAVPIGEKEIEVPADCFDPTTDHVAVGYSSPTSVTVAATTD